MKITTKQTARPYLPRSWWFRAIFAATLIALGAFLWLEDMRANILAELWGVAGAGIVVWWVLERYGWKIQRQAWLRQHAEHTAVPIWRIGAAAQMIASIAVDIRPEDNAVIATALDPKQRKPLTTKMQARLDAIANGQEGEAGLFGDRTPREIAGMVVLALTFPLHQIDQEASQHAYVLEPLTEVRGHIASLKEASGLLSREHEAGAPDENLRGRRVIVAKRAWALADACQAISWEMRD